MYDPETDPGVEKLEKLRVSGASQEELLQAELELIEQTDNGPKENDPESVIDS